VDTDFFFCRWTEDTEFSWVSDGLLHFQGLRSTEWVSERANEWMINVAANLPLHNPCTMYVLVFTGFKLARLCSNCDNAVLCHRLRKLNKVQTNTTNCSLYKNKNRSSYSDDCETVLCYAVWRHVLSNVDRRFRG
jgi:hypothetical protein